MSIRRVAWSTAVGIMSIPGLMQSQEPSVATVAERLGVYATAFQQRFSNIVAEERYVQDVTYPNGPPIRFPTQTHRELRSDILLVRPEGADRYLEFRDVFEVDGRPVRDRQDRLTTLFLHPSASGDGQIQQISRESARYNIGNIGRTINTPTLPLQFLLPRNQPRFRFAHSNNTVPAMASASGTRGLVLEYDEVQRPTLIRATGGSDLPAHGRLWVDAQTGRVLMTELIAEDPLLRATIDVTYQWDRRAEMMVPADMHERYNATLDGAVILGVATYGKIRQFQVQANEGLGPAEHTQVEPQPDTPPVVGTSPAPSDPDATDVSLKDTPPEKTTGAVPTAFASPQGAASPRPVFKSGVEYVEVDAVVANARGQLVRDLTKSDFEVFEDGKKQAVTTFAFVDIPIEASGRPLNADQPIEADVITNGHPEGRLYVLVLDELHTAPLAVQRSKTAAKQFIERLGANDLMAVVHTAGADTASQAFTNSQSRLLAEVDKVVGHGLASATASRNETAFNSGGRDTSDHDDLERAADAQTTLRVVRDVANWFASVHGRRKAILLMSEGIDYPMTFADQPDQPNRPTDMLLNTAQDAIDAANRSNVSVYGIDPAGLTGIDDIGVEYFFGPGNRAMGTRGFQRELEMQQESLRWLSEQTGGAAVVGRNDLGKAFDQIISDNSAYYVLAYQRPTNKRDGKFHKITVRVNRSGLVTRARSGYLSPKGKPPATPTLDPAGPSRELRDALASSVPIGGLTMRVSLAPFMGAAPNASVLLTEELRGRDLKLGAPGTLELSYVAVDGAGKVRAGSNDRLQLRALKPDTQAQIEQSGLRVVNRVALPPGRYAMRIATHDEAGGALGSVAYDLDVPDFYALPFSMSGLVLTSLATGRMVVAKADAQMKDVLPAPPIAERSFPQHDQVWVFAEVYDNAGTSAHTLNIGTTLTSAAGTVVYQVDESHASSDIAGPRATYKYRTRVPLNDLAPGEYVLTVEARARLGHEESSSRQVPITVTAAEKK